jgi:hypothetical protein
MTRPTQHNLFAPAKEPPPEPFEFLADGPECEPDPTWTPPDFLKLPTDDPDWAPKGRFG